MIQNRTTGNRIFNFINYSFMGVVGLICILPILHILVMSLSDMALVAANRVSLLPKGINIENYKEIFRNSYFLNSVFISVKRVIMGTALNMFLITLTAYPLSMTSGEVKGRTAYMWFLVFPMLFSGGLIPTFILVKNLGLIDKIWALILPMAVPIFNVILMTNFFRTLPRSMYESAVLDGADHLSILYRIYIPLSKAAIATVGLFCILAHWNAWFDGMIYMNDINKYPLQTLLQALITNQGGFASMGTINQREFERMMRLTSLAYRSAQIIIGIIPILLIYPFLQRYFVKGVVLGAVKE